MLFDFNSRTKDGGNRERNEKNTTEQIQSNKVVTDKSFDLSLRYNSRNWWTTPRTQRNGRSQDWLLLFCVHNNDLIAKFNRKVSSRLVDVFVTRMDMDNLAISPLMQFKKFFRKESKEQFVVQPLNTIQTNCNKWWIDHLTDHREKNVEIETFNYDCFRFKMLVGVITIIVITYDDCICWGKRNWLIRTAIGSNHDSSCQLWCNWYIEQQLVSVESFPELGLFNSQLVLKAAIKLLMKVIDTNERWKEADWFLFKQKIVSSATLFSSQVNLRQKQKLVFGKGSYTPQGSQTNCWTYQDEGEEWNLCLCLFYLEARTQLWNVHPGRRERGRERAIKKTMRGWRR